MRMLMSSIVVLSVACASGCSSIDVTHFERADTIYKFESERQALEYAIARDKALAVIAKPDSAYRSYYSGDNLEAEEVVVTGIRASDIGHLAGNAEALQRLSSITNNQEAMVDEGGIVKRAGDYLIVLRHGRLFSVFMGETLNKVDEISVQPESWRHDAWYDELLVDGKHIVVTGYSYENDCTEYVYVTINDDGTLTWSAAYLVSSDDYYSENNYASRLVNGNLVFYLENLSLSNLSLEEDGEASSNPFAPRAARVDARGRIEKDYALFYQNDIYSPVIAGYGLSVTAIAVCPLNNEDLSCRATSVIGGYVDEYYASADAYYLWMSGKEWNTEYERIPSRYWDDLADSYRAETDADVAAVYRIPFDSGHVGVVKVQGHPLDQFSFKQDGENLYVVAREASDHGQYFVASYSEGESFLTQIPLASFDLGVTRLADSNRYYFESGKRAPRRNRFVGDNLVFTRDYDNSQAASTIFVVNVNQPSLTTELQSSLYTEQIHPIGRNALVVGLDENETVSYQSLRLGSGAAHLVDILTEPYGAMAENRSHGFYYRPDSEGGLFAIPVEQELEGASYKRVEGIYYELEPVADMLITRVFPDLSMRSVGVLRGDRQAVWTSEDDCDLSCYDWYGSSRPIFWDGRIFALLKYELIESELHTDRLTEKQRLNIRN